MATPAEAMRTLLDRHNGVIPDACLYCGAIPGERHRPVLRGDRSTVCPDRAHEIVTS